ncbi:aminomethyl-transferring glycine dehydrogenase subunit GcvPB [Candidatus Formimonas warabiya]|uniref:Probable glycine dehydrogenase (decarboxylating) subunit 2 n=1 Tax=Formimonas warabiya TaxID=1761012 RepID=A0A3G1KX19_FORW1|nr:aminomethyl-transferring glycine dehydrogenase subunit GcvPB [Candidatus Formimonas warabiya]ATW27038.1 glycine dehydrogenase (aminomethyl-transferring) [Candidatus Formimonas warabiya]
MKEKSLIFEISRPGRKAYGLPRCDVPEAPVAQMIPSEYLRAVSPELPEVSELDAVRHFTRLSQRNHGVDSGFYPLGSCTMKYNPKINEALSRLDGFTKLHPYQPEETVQGALELMYLTDQMLAEIAGMDRVSLQPAAGAHGEMTGLMIIKAYHQYRGDHRRTKIVVPDAAHGTNPASAAVAGFDVIEVKSSARGGVDLAALRSLMSEEIAGLMLTNPNTLGLFEENIREIAEIVHQAGGLLYYDGANANAIMGITRPGDMGFDVVHLNLHKTFSTPHGGGGPGAGPVGVKKDLVPFLPKPLIECKDGKYYFDYDRPLSIGKVKAFYGNFNVVVKAYAFIRSMGPDGLKQASEAAVLNANYLAAKLKDVYQLPYDRICMHECVLSGQSQKNKGVSTLDIAKRLLDFGFHPPTIYFPLIVHEALMIEPTESESKETLDEFIQVLRQIAGEVDTDPDMVRSAPHQTVVGRLDEAAAARNPVVRWKPGKQG